MSEVIMMMGLPGAGKDHWMNKLYPNHVHISSDDIRIEVFGDVNDQSHNGEVFNIMWKRLVAALKEEKSVVYNATNLSAKRRINFIDSIKRLNLDVRCKVILVAPPLERVLEQNSKRDRVVPESVIHRMLKQFEMPHESEGWYKIEIFGNQCNYEHLFGELFAAMSNPHDNPHHSATIGDHMHLAGEYIRERLKNELSSSDRDIYYPAEMMVLAADFHDIGKPYCKVYHNAKGEPTEDAHYYNHENVGSYIYISHSDGDEVDIWIANLIAHHMDFFKGEAYMKKIKARFPDKFIKDLELLHEADLAAH